MKDWMWYTIAGVLGAIFGGLVLYFVITHKENGLLHVCWRQGQAVYDQDRCTTKLVWPKNKLPLKVFVHENKALEDAAVAAITAWNREVGPVFLRTKNKGAADVVVYWGSIAKYQGHTQHYGSIEPQRATVTITLYEELHTVTAVVMHELGHVLGLAHDEQPNTLMAPQHQNVPIRKLILRPSDHDKKLLRTLYVP